MQKSNGFIRTLALGAGFGIGGLWILLAIAALRSSAQGFGFDRLDWGVGWGLIGLLLLAAGSCAIGATLWHFKRVRSYE